jgi:hypothetical protein
MRAVGVLCVLLALGGVLRRVTRPWEAGAIPAAEGGREPVVPTGGETATAAVPVRITFSAPVRRAELRHLGKVVWSAEAPAGPQSLTLRVPFPPEGIELGARIEWVAAGPSAVRVQVTAPDGTELDRTAWGESVLETVLPFP